MTKPTETTLAPDAFTQIGVSPGIEIIAPPSNRDSVLIAFNATDPGVFLVDGKTFTPTVVLVPGARWVPAVTDTVWARAASTAGPVKVQVL